MLLQFSIKNFKTFKDKVTLSFIASNYDKGTREDENIYINEKFGLRLLKSAVVYGANASGKSNLFDAMGFMKTFVINSSKESQKGESIGVEPFRLGADTENEPSEFEAIFLFNNILYRYGFEATQQMIFSEWLFYKPETKEIELFYREDDNFDIHERNFSKGKAIVKEGLVRDNALLLSVAAQFNDKTAIDIIDWFKRFQPISGIDDSSFPIFTMWKSKDAKFKEKVLELLKVADLGIHDFNFQQMDIENLYKDVPKEIRNGLNEIKEDLFKVLTTHKQYDSNKTVVDNRVFSLDNEESAGTAKFFYLAGPILDALENGYTLIVDELDASLHPNLVCKIVSMFNSKEFNKKNAQLIFNTQNTNLLSSGLFRRDQIWFTEKDKYGEAKLYSLADFKKIRKNESYEDKYIKGKYGAVPFLGFFDNFINTFSHEKEE
jgi:AAA15 family ATPase/GTPase